MPKEIWKPAPPPVQPGFYEVSNTGLIRRLGGTPKCKKTRILKLTPSPDGYIRVYPIMEGPRSSLLIHRLVAGAFLAKPASATEVNHKDFNKSNNRVSNLEWVSRQENVAWTHKSGRCKKGEAAGMAKITEKTAIQIRKLFKKGWKQSDIAEATGVPFPNVWAIVRRVSWKHLSI